MESKYYTPELSEFHVGFEFELKIPGEHFWRTEDISDFEGPQIGNWPFEYALENGCLRVKYLDREDIESCGWQKLTDELKKQWNPEEQMIYYYETIDHNLFYLNFYTDEIYTNRGLDFVREKVVVVIDGEGKFSGEIKNKSELKKLMKQIGI